jgi:hypothetical protein
MKYTAVARRAFKRGKALIPTGNRNASLMLEVRYCVVLRDWKEDFQRNSGNNEFSIFGLVEQLKTAPLAMQTLRKVAGLGL